jgi:hypothetical protein
VSRVEALTSADVAHLLGVTRRAILSVDRERLPFTYEAVGGQNERRYTTIDLLAYLAWKRGHRGNAMVPIMPKMRPVDTVTPISTLRAAILWEMEQARRLFAEPAQLKRVA